MVSTGVVLCGFAAALCLSGGVRELWTMHQMRRRGLRTTGRVVGHDVSPGENSDIHTPVVRFVDHHGVSREFRGKLSGSSRHPREGVEVPVLYFPDRTHSARIASRGYVTAGLTLCFVAGSAFSAAAVAIYLNPQ